MEGQTRRDLIRRVHRVTAGLKRRRIPLLTEMVVVEVADGVDEAPAAAAMTTAGLLTAAAVTTAEEVGAVATTTIEAVMGEAVIEAAVAAVTVDEVAAVVAVVDRNKLLPTTNPRHTTRSATIRA